MKLYLISQSENDGYDTYSDAVVCAESEEDAKKIHPSDYRDDEEVTEKEEQYGTWTTLSNVDAKYIGEAKEGSERGVVCSSFHAG